jgi:hypothetical protein
MANPAQEDELSVGREFQAKQEKKEEEGYFEEIGAAALQRILSECAPCGAPSNLKIRCAFTQTAAWQGRQAAGRAAED